MVKANSLPLRLTSVPRLLVAVVAAVENVVAVEATVAVVAVEVNVVAVEVTAVAVEATVEPVEATVPVPLELKVKKALKSNVPTTAMVTKRRSTKVNLVKELTLMTVKTELAEPTAVTAKKETPREPGATKRRPSLVKLLKVPKSPRVTSPNVSASLVKIALLVNAVKVVNVVKVVSVENAVPAKRRRSKSPSLKRRKLASLSKTTWLSNKLSPLVSSCLARPVITRRPP